MTNGLFVILKITDARGGNLENEAESYIEAIDGNDLILSIDMTIQSIAEKYLINGPTYL